MPTRLPLLAILSICAVLTSAAPSHAQTINQKSKYTLLSANKKEILCALTKKKNKPLAVKKAKVMVNGKKKKLLVSIGTDIKAKKILLKQLNKDKKKNKNKIKKEKAKLAKLKLSMDGCKKGPPIADPASLALSENGSLSITLTGSTPRSGGLNFIITQAPSMGSLSGSAPSLNYAAKAHALGSDEFLFQVADKYLLSAPAKVSLTINASSAEFAGDAQSLAPYRAKLTEFEAVEFLKKVALGGDQALVDIGVNQGLTALIDALVSDPVPSDLDGQALANAGYGADFRWGTTNAARYWVTYMMRGNQLRENLSYILHDHFATNLTQFDRALYSHNAIIDHLQLLRSHALGNFEELTKLMVRDLAMNYWLDNRFNTKTSLNENFPRELLELFTLGAVSYVTGAPNYDYSTIQGATKSLTGYFTYIQGNQELVGFEATNFDDSLKTIFPGTPWATTANLDADSLIHHVLWNHPEAARFIVGKLFRQLAHPEPSLALLDELAQLLKDSNFELEPVVRKILGSSAMFSAQAHKVCVDSPAQYLVTFMHRAGLPANSDDTIAALVTNMLEAGNGLLKPDSVFGFGGCGINRDAVVNSGEVWVASQRILNTVNAINDLINVVTVNESGFDLLSIVPSPQAQPGEIVDHLSRRLGVKLSDTSQLDLINYLTTQRIDQNGSESFTSFNWDDADVSLKRAKIAGLLHILATTTSNRAR